MVEEVSVSLRELEIEDAAGLAAIINNKNVWDNIDDVPFPNTKKDSEDFIRFLSSEKDRKIAFAICYDSIMVGWIGVFRRENIRRLTGELGYYIAEEYWGRGIATEAIIQMCNHTFENTDVVRIFAEAFVFNEASSRVLEKANFLYEGLLHQNAIKNGQIIDLKLYAITKTRWEETNTTKTIGNQINVEKERQKSFDKVSLRPGVDRDQAFKLVKLALDYFDDKYLAELAGKDELNEEDMKKFMEERNGFLSMIRYGIEEK